MSDEDHSDPECLPCMVQSMQNEVVDFLDHFGKRLAAFENLLDEVVARTDIAPQRVCEIGQVLGMLTSGCNSLSEAAEFWKRCIDAAWEAQGGDDEVKEGVVILMPTPDSGNN